MIGERALSRMLSELERLGPNHFHMSCAPDRSSHKQRSLLAVRLTIRVTAFYQCAKLGK